MTAWLIASLPFWALAALLAIAGILKLVVGLRLAARGDRRGDDRLAAAAAFLVVSGFFGWVAAQMVG